MPPSASPAAPTPSVPSSATPPSTPRAPAPAPPSSAPRAPSPDTGDAAVPALQERVTDRTNTLDAATRSALTSQLAALEARKGAQVAVLIVPTTQPESIEQYATRAFDQWKLGRKNTDDGVLLLVAKDDRTLRIEVGYGLEGAIPDSRASQIINEQIVPRFASGDFAGGIDAGVKSIAALVDGEPLPPPASRGAPNEMSVNLPTLTTSLIVGVIMVLVLPTLVGVAAVAVAAYTATGMLWVAGVAAVLALVLTVVLHALGIKGGGKGGGGKGGGKGGGGGGGRRAGAILGGLGGLRGGSMGGGRSSGGGFGGGFGGGGGRSGGGGASGRW
ncbi:YgcG family protein [Achromobacter sp. KS-M25]|nr:YgcG family protein [Achromobacter aestuarii]